MRYRKLGRTDIQVSVISMGCWPMADPRLWGPQDESESIAAIHASLDAGVNFIDTAEGYGHGYSEELVGKALVGRRSGAVICTKVSPENQRGVDMVAACEASLCRLRTDWLDLYLLHWPNHELGVEEPLRAMERLRDDGKVRAIGVSNFATADLADGLALGRLEVDQLPYNLLWRAIEYEVGPQCLANDVSITCYSALMHGLLSGRFAAPDDVPIGQARSGIFSGERPMAPHDGPGAEAQAFATLNAIRAVSEQSGLPMARLALAWLCDRPGVASAIVGARTVEEARDNAAAGDLALSRDVVAELDEATRGLKEHFGGANPDLWQLPDRMR
jgi:aryl-alcohol dehydrogenase-like predicted oxidoreductase